MPDIDFYYDPISPYVWLATRQLDRIRAAGGRLRLRPVLFAAMLNAHGQKGPAEIPAKRTYTFTDVMRQAARLGLRFQGPPGHPFNPLLTLRLATAIEDEASRLAFACAASAACWEDGADLSDTGQMRAILDKLDLNAEALLAAAQSPEIKQALAAASADAIGQGLFGVPAFVCDGHLFWGADRIDDLIWHLGGGRIDHAAREAFLAKAPTAHRKT